MNIVKLKVKRTDDDVVFLPQTCSSVFVKAYTKENLDMAWFSYMCMTEKLIYSKYFQGYCGRNWWHDNYCLEDIMERMQLTKGIRYAKRSYPLPALE